MKKFCLSLLTCISIFSIGCTVPMQTSVSVQETMGASHPVGQTEVTYQVFYDELAPFGRWINYPEYGNVWLPNVGSGFQPYATNGHWVFSNAGWTWVSNYNWGWATFHYGRWFFEEGYGWLWLPGHEWAPAWVTWGHSGAYYGWAPLGPRINAGDEWSPPSHAWTFVPQEHMNKPDLEHYAMDRKSNTNFVKNVTIIDNHTINVTNNNSTVVNNNSSVVNRTAVINNNSNNSNTHNSDVVNNQHGNNTQFNTGPHVTEVEKAANTRIQPVNINEHSKPALSTVNDNKLYMYKPTIMHDEKQKQIISNKPAPKNVEQYKPHQ